MWWRMANADGESLRDLELIMDANVDAAAGANAFLRPVHSSGSLDEEKQEPHSNNEVDKPTNRQFFPGNVASLSLALGSMMPSNCVLSKVGVLPSRAPTKLGTAVPSQKKAHVPIPVKPSAKIKFGLDTEHQQQQSLAKKISNSATAFPDYQMLPKSGKSYSDPANGAGMRKASIVWFRNDLRVHDNEALAVANKESLSVIPVYCFDPRDYGKSSSGFDKTGPYRAKFLLECVASLRDSLRERGSDLIVRVGNPEEVLSTVAKSVGADGLYAHQEVSAEELILEEKVASVFKDHGVDVKYFWGSTLFHIEDLPFKLDNMPSNYGGFREQVKDVRVRPACEAPKQLKGLPSQGDVKPGAIPTLQELGVNPIGAAGQDRQAAKGGALIGGEAEALKRLKTFSLEAPTTKGKTASSSDSGNSLYGANFSCKISPWLAMGCVSPRKMFEDLKKNTSRFVASVNASKGSATATDDSGMQWLVFELLWRDFFRFITKKYGSSRKNQTVVSPAPCGAAALAGV